MKILSFDNEYYKVERNSDQYNLFDLFQKNIVNDTSLQLRIYIVPREYEMRLDRISEHIYGSSDYVEELMTLNDIINPYSVKEGQYIYFCQLDYLTNMYIKDELLKYMEEKRNELIASSQPNNNKTNILLDNKNLSPTIKPNNLQHVTITKDNKITIMNSFE